MIKTKRLFAVVLTITMLFCITINVNAETEVFNTDNQIETAIQKALTVVNDGMTDAEKALAIHDYIILNCEYDTTLTKRSIYNCLVEKKAVCLGYALAYQEIMLRLGIECETIISYAMNHAWNYIKINDNWYHVDVTWDDPLLFTDYDYFGQVFHEYFLLSDESIQNKESPHYGWNTNGLPKAEDTTYDNFFWQSVESGIFHVNGDWYYIERSEKYPYYYNGRFDRTLAYVNKYNFGTEETEKIYSIFSTWYVWDEEKTENYFYLRNFAKLAVNNGYLYFNTADSVYRVNSDGEDLTEICSTEDNEGYIYGVTVCDDVLKYVIKHDYFDEGVFFTEELITVETV